MLLSISAQTADTSPLGTLLVMALLALVVIAVLLVRRAVNKKRESLAAGPAMQEPAAQAQPDLPASTFGELKLYDVDDKTAALLMAIVSDASQIPLARLRFKSIRPLPEKM